MNHWIKTNPFFTLNDFEDIYRLVSESETPSFIYSRKVIERQYSLLKDNLPEKIKIFYAQKSNPNKGILNAIKDLGAGCDTASLGEMAKALDAGFPEDKIMLTGPAKTQRELAFALQRKIYSINVESLQELELLNKLAEQIGTKQEILVRINPPFEAGETNTIIGGMGVSKFGIDVDYVPEFIESALKMKNVVIKGIHIFNSSQILDWRKIYRNTIDVIDSAMEISSNFEIELKRLDMGGGFGIPYAQNEKELDIVTLGSKVAELLEAPDYKDFLSNAELIYEPGRYLSGMSGIYITKVLYTKVSNGRKIALIDGGIHHLIRPILIGQPHPIVNLTAIRNGRNETDKYMVAGPLCTSLDRFDTSAVLNEVHPGDILAVLNAGAYGYTESMPLFLSHKPAPEIFLN